MASRRMLQKVPETSGASFETPLTRLLRMRTEGIAGETKTAPLLQRGNINLFALGLRSEGNPMCCAIAGDFKAANSGARLRAVAGLG